MRCALLILLLAVCLPVQADMSIKTIHLHHRTAQEVIGILKPLLDKGGSLSGSGYMLFIKSSPDNIAQLRQMLTQIDVAARNLLVSVSLDPAVMQEKQQASVNIQAHDGQSTLSIGNSQGRVSSTGHNRHHKGRIMYDARLLQQRQTQHYPQVQTVRVSEGLWASIQTGQAVPIASRTRHADGTVTDTYTYQAVASGFQVLPRVNGDNVTLKIRPQAQNMRDNHNGTYHSTEVDTTVSGKLGQWIPLGGVAQSRQSSSTGIAYHTQQHRNESNQIFVKVELAKP